MCVCVSVTQLIVWDGPQSRKANLKPMHSQIFHEFGTGMGGHLAGDVVLEGYAKEAGL